MGVLETGMIGYIVEVVDRQHFLPMSGGKSPEPIPWQRFRVENANGHCKLYNKTDLYNLGPIK